MIVGCKSRDHDEGWASAKPHGEKDSPIPVLGRTLVSTQQVVACSGWKSSR